PAAITSTTQRSAAYDRPWGLRNSGVKDRAPGREGNIQQFGVKLANAVRYRCVALLGLSGRLLRCTGSSVRRFALFWHPLQTTSRLDCPLACKLPVVKQLGSQLAASRIWRPSKGRGNA